MRAAPPRSEPSPAASAGMTGMRAYSPIEKTIVGTNTTTTIERQRKGGPAEDIPPHVTP